jgi:hypothetical protein
LNEVHTHPADMGAGIGDVRLPARPMDRSVKPRCQRLWLEVAWPGTPGLLPARIPRLRPRAVPPGAPGGFASPRHPCPIRRGRPRRLAGHARSQPGLRRLPADHHATCQGRRAPRRPRPHRTQERSTYRTTSPQDRLSWPSRRGATTPQPAPRQISPGQERSLPLRSPRLRDAPVAGDGLRHFEQAHPDRPAFYAVRVSRCRDTPRASFPPGPHDGAVAPGAELAPPLPLPPERAGRAHVMSAYS